MAPSTLLSSPPFKASLFTILSVWILFSLCHLGHADDEYTAPLRRSRRAADGLSVSKLRVVTINMEPYTMEANISNRDNYQGKFRGFIPDVLREFENILNIKFEVYVVPDNRFGSLVNGKWNGMIGEIIKKEHGDETGADLAAAPLTITSAREGVVDFLKPFQNLGVSMLTKRFNDDQKGSNDYNDWYKSFTVLKPLSPEVWVAVTTGILVVSLILWGNNRINPYEWGGRHNLGRASESASEHFNFSGSAWFVFTTLQWQGFEKAPRSLSSKTLTVFWFIFITLTLLTYTASLVNNLFWASTVHEQQALHIQTLGDLVASDKYDYGYMEGGSIEKFFQMSILPIHYKMRKYWQTDRGKNALVSSPEDGLAKVMKGNYVFFTETTTAKYLAGKNCNLTVFGETLGQRSFGMAIRHNLERDVFDALHMATLELIEEGDMEMIERKWWQGLIVCDLIPKIKEFKDHISALYLNDPKSVTLDMFMGPLLLLLVGIVLAVIVAIAEIIYYKHKGRYRRTNRPAGPQLQLDEDDPTS